MNSQSLASDDVIDYYTKAKAHLLEFHSSGLLELVVAMNEVLEKNLTTCVIVKEECDAWDTYNKKGATCPAGSILLEIVERRNAKDTYNVGIFNGYSILNIPFALSECKRGELVKARKAVGQRRLGEGTIFRYDITRKELTFFRAK